MNHLARRTACALAVGITVALATTTAATATPPSADVDKTGVSTAAASVVTADPAAQSQPSVAPVGSYQQVVSAGQIAAAGTQTLGTVTCPAGTKVMGGGAVIDGTDRQRDLNGSLPAPNGSGWRAFVNNASATDGTFRVMAVCARRMTRYAIVTGAAADNPAFQQNRATADCPTGTVPLGGGGYGSSTSNSVGLNATAPTGTSWYVDINNDSAVDNTARAVVVCGTKPAGYRVANGIYGRVGPESQSSGVTATCPSGLAVLGGGAETEALRTSVDLNSTAPFASTQWGSYYNNSSSQRFKIRSVTVCARPTA